MENIISAEDIYYQYKDGTMALKGLSCSVPRGARMALLGPNGAGKSTLLLHLNALLLAQKGTLRVLGKPVSKKNENWVREKVGLVFQDPDDQVFSTTVWDDVAFGPINLGLPAREVAERVKECLALVGMEGTEEKVPHHMSYGQKKRVAIAGVLAMDPEVVVFDEPTAYLDPQGREALLVILERLQKAGKTLIVATHDMDLVMEWADKVIIVKDGKTLAEGGTELLLEEDLLCSANLRLPLIARIFAGVPGEKPRTVAQAQSYLTGLVK